MVLLSTDTVGAHLRLDYTTDEASPRTVESEYHSRKHAFVGPEDLRERNRNGTNLNRLQPCHRGKTAAHRLKSLAPERAVFCLHTSRLLGNRCCLSSSKMIANLCGSFLLLPVSRCSCRDWLIIATMRVRHSVCL